MKVSTWNTLQPGERIVRLDEEDGRGVLTEFEVVDRQPSTPDSPALIELRNADTGKCIHSIYHESFLIRSGAGSGV